MTEYDALILTGYSTSAFPLGAYRIRTELEKVGYAVKVLDYCWDLDQQRLEDVCREFITQKTKFFGLSNNWIDGSWKLGATQVCEYVKLNFPWVQIIEGGQGPNKAFRKTKWWVQGFGDIAAVRLFNHVIRGEAAPTYTLDGDGTRIVKADISYTVTDYDSLGTTWKTEDRIQPFHPLPIEIGRGCIFNCAFCHHPFLGKKKGTYIRSTQSIAAEFKRNHEMFGTTRYQFIDDTFNDDVDKIATVLAARDLVGVDIEFVCFLRAELLVTQPQSIPMMLDLGLRSAHLGIESLNMEGRKAVGKGMAVERVMDAIADMRQRSNNTVSNFGSFIVGLPGDTEENVKANAEWCNAHRDTHLQSWWHYPLNLNLDSTNLSKMEKDPESYGYTVEGGEWKNNAMTKTQARALAIELNHVTHRANMRASGYTMAYGWASGMSDHEIENTPFLDLNYTPGLLTQSRNYFENICIKK